MRAIFLKELNAFLRGRKGWILLAVLAFVNGTLVSYFHFYLGNTRYEILIGTMMLVVSLLLPIWVIPSLSREKNEEEEGFLRLFPIEEKDVFLGKLLAAVAILFGMMLLLGITPLVLSFFGGTQLVYSYLALAVAFLMGCALLSGIVFFTVFFKKRRHAWIAAYVFVGVLFIGSRIVAGASSAVGTVIRYVLLFNAFSPLSYDLFTWNILLLYVGVALGFLGATFLVLDRKGALRLFKKGIVSSVLAIVLVVALVGSAFLPAYARSMDMSVERSMNVSTTTQKYLSGLSEDVTLYLLTDDLSEDSYRDYRFEAFLDRYASYGKKITLERVPLSESGSLLAEFGVTEPTASYAYCVVAKSALRSQIVSFGDMLTYMHESTNLTSLGIPAEFSTSKYATYLETLYEYATSDSGYATYYYEFIDAVKLHFKGETILNELVSYVSATIIPRPYVLTGHGEPDLKGLLLGSLMSGYSTLSLTESNGVPADAASLLLLAPTTDYTADEIRLLTEYLNGGGTLTVITGESALDLPNLMQLMSAYGLSAEKGAVRSEVVTSETTEGETTEGEPEEGAETAKVKYLDYVTVAINDQHDALASISAIGITDHMIQLYGGNAISFHKTDDTSLTTTALFTTGDTAFITEDGERKSYTLGAVAENNRGARLIWFTGAKNYLLTESDITAESEESLIYPLFAPYLTSAWTNLRYTSNVAELPAVRYEEPYLEATETGMIVYVLLFALALPAGLVATGLVKNYKRKKA